ncbi:MAG: hypothetical protein RR872_02665 [Mucinivorans sp.]
MRRFTYYIFLFILPIIFVLPVFEVATRAIPNSYRYKNGQLSLLADSLEVLILGSSHAYMGLNPECFSLRAFNAGNVSQTLCYDDYIVQKFIPKMPKLKYVILPISYFTFFSTLQNSDEWYREIYYTLYMDFSKYGLFTKQHYEIANWSVAIVKLRAYYINGEDLEQVSATGMSKMYYLKNKAVKGWDNGVSRAKAHLSEDLNDEIMVENIAFLDNIASLTDNMGAQLILVTTPVRKSYSHHINVGQLSQMHNNIERVLKEHKSVSYLDFLTDSSYTDDDFFDADHLTELGANKLSRKIDSLMMNN